jgi:hypothetical protein
MMNLKGISNVFTSKAGRQVLLAEKHSPTILFGAGIIGVVVTVVLASKATLKLEEVLEETQAKVKDAQALNRMQREDYSDRDYRQDVAYIHIRSALHISKLYGPAFVAGVISVGCLAGSHQILSRRNAGLMAAYAAVEKGFAQYRDRVLAEVGPDKEREFRYGKETREIVEETDHGPEVTTVTQADPNAHSVYAKFFDQFSSSWEREAEYNRIFLQCQQNYANDKLRARGHLFLNEVYDMLGIERTKAGAVVGWVMSKDGDNYVDFGLFNADNPRARDFVNGREGAILLDFNVDGVIYDKI